MCVYWTDWKKRLSTYLCIAYTYTAGPYYDHSDPLCTVCAAQDAVEYSVQCRATWQISPLHVLVISPLHSASHTTTTHARQHLVYDLLAVQTPQQVTICVPERRRHLLWGDNCHCCRHCPYTYLCHCIVKAKKCSMHDACVRSSSTAPSSCLRCGMSPTVSRRGPLSPLTLPWLQCM